MSEAPTRALVLGHSRLELAGAPVELTRIQRRLVARLAATPGSTIGLEDLFAAVWDDDPPSTARAAIHNQVSRLRSLAGHDVIQTTPAGYRLAVPTDAEALRTAVRDAEQALAADPGRALDLAESALAMAAGPPFADLAPASLVADRQHELGVLLDAAADAAVEAALALGLAGRALPAARRRAADAPCDEACASRLARALDQAGRRGEALAEISRVRRALRTDLGLDGSPALDVLESAIRGAAAPRASAAAAMVPAEVLAVAESGGSCAVSSASAAAVSRLLVATHDALLTRRHGTVALVEVRGYRDVAVAALLDLLDLLGLETVPELGPVGTFVPAVERLAAQRAVVLLVDGFDAAGPSTRRVLLEAAGRPGIALVAGLHDRSAAAMAADFDTAVVVADDDDETQRSARRRRFAALPPQLRATLTAVAIAGNGVTTAALREVGAADGLPGALARDILHATPAGAISFVDDAWRALVVADTPAGIRDELHHALGRVLARLGSTEDAARHLFAAREIEPPAAVNAARAAAAAASGLGAHDDAVSWLRRAVDCCRDPRTRIAITIELGDALRLSGDATHVATLREAADQAARLDDEELLGEAVFALLQLGGTTVSTSVDPAVDALLARTLPRLRDQRRIALVRGAASLAFSMTGSAQRSRSLFLAAEQAATDPATRRRVLPFAYMGLGAPADLDRRRELTAELLALANAADDPVAAYEGLHLAASVALQDGDGVGLRRTHQEMTALVDRVGDVGRRWALHYLAAAIAHLDGDGARVEELSRAAFAQFAPVSESRATAVLFGQLFGLRLSQGRVSELRPVLETLVPGQPGTPWNAALALSMAQADPPQAVAIAGEAVGSIQPDFAWLAAQLVAARAVALAVRAGADDRGLLERCRAQLARWSGRVSWQGTCSYGPVDTTLGLIADAGGDATGARALATTALHQAQRLGAPAFADELRALGLIS
jgi:DNA-binding SARP family transcriptional activator